MIAYLYMLLATVVLVIGSVSSKDISDFFQNAAERNKVNLYYDYLYAVIEYVNDNNYCDKSDCTSGKSISLSGYDTDEVNVCKSDDRLYAFYSSKELTSKPFVSLSGSNYSIVSGRDVPKICGNLISDDSFALCYSVTTDGCA